MRIREHFEERFRLAAKEPNPELKKQMLSFVVAGAGFTGIELMGEFAERRDILCEKYHIPISDVTMVTVEALDSILPILEKKLREKVVSYLESKGVEILRNARITGAEEGKVLLADGTEILTDTFIWTCGIHGSEFTSRIDLTKGNTARGECSVASAEGIHGMCGCRFEEDERHVVGIRGRILVNEFMQSPDYDNVYAVGDNLWFVENEKVLPQIVETAIQTGNTAAKNIIADLENTTKQAFKSHYHGFMVSVGGKYGVSNAGGMKVSGFMAMAMKHLVNMHYLFGIAGFNAVWTYLKHEFFDMKDRRTFLGEHLSWKIQGLWAIPLRIWLGVMWLLNGIYALQTAGIGSAFSTVMMVFELAIGIALISGLFTWLAALGSIVISLIFIVSGVFAWNQLWIVFAAFLMLGGAGRCLGLDYWVMPALTRKWNGTKFARRTHLYLGEPKLKI